MNPTESPNKLADKLQEEGEKTIQFFQALPESTWGIILYEDGATWRVRDILAHFVATEIAIPLILRDIIQGGEGVPEGFDLDDYNRRHVSGLENFSREELLTRFADLRGQTVRLVRLLSEQDLLRTGRHPFLGVSPLVDMIKLMYRHIQIHQRDIRRAVNASSP
jgi:hypothetical protein